MGSWAIPKVTVSFGSLLVFETVLAWVLVFPTVAGTVATLLAGAGAEVTAIALGWSVIVGAVLDCTLFPSCGCFCSLPATVQVIKIYVD